MTLANFDVRFTHESASTSLINELCVILRYGYQWGERFEASRMTLEVAHLRLTR
jgi:hypothetical protein